jgi:hypothetical protein
LWICVSAISTVIEAAGRQQHITSIDVSIPGFQASVYRSDKSTLNIPRWSMLA